MSEDETLIDFRGVKIVPEEAKLIEEMEEEVGEIFPIKDLSSDEDADLYIKNGHLVEIYMAEIKFSRKHVNIFKFLKVQIIKLFDSIVPNIPKDAEKLIHLQILVLSNVNIQSIEANFDRLLQLNELYISKGHLERLPKLPPQLKKIGLVNLGLQTFPIELNKCTLVAKLQLQENIIDLIPNWVSKFTCLGYLNMRNNPIKTVCDFAPMISLYCLDLKRSKLNEFPESLGSLHKMDELSLGAQGFPKVLDLFENLPDLEYLYLNGFDLNEFPNTISKCKKLKKLNLDYCKMELAKPQLRGLRRLSSLSLVGCNLKTLFDGIFITRKKIDIRNNLIEKMPEKWLQYADRLIIDESTWKNPIRPLDLSDDNYLIMLAAMKKIIEPIYSTGRLMGRTLGAFKEDFFIKFSDENILAEEGDLVYSDEIMGLQHLPDGRPFIGLHVGGDWEYPVYVVVFNVKDELHAFVPLKSNTFNHLNDSAYGNNDNLDKRAIDEIILKMGRNKILSKPLEEKLNILDYSVDVGVILEEIKQKMDEIMGNIMN